MPNTPNTPRPIHQHMTSPNSPRQPYYSVTYRQITPEVTLVDAHSLLISAQLRVDSRTNFLFVSSVTADYAGEPADVENHIYNLLGYAEYLVKVRFKGMPFVVVDEQLVDERMRSILARRKYSANPLGAWARQVFRDTGSTSVS